MIISVKVKIPVTSDRTISIPFALNLSCEDWHTGNGTVQIVGQTGPPSIEGGNIIEDVLMVRDLIDNLIRSKLTLQGLLGFRYRTLPALPSAPHEANLLAIHSPSSLTIQLRGFDQFLIG